MPRTVIVAANLPAAPARLFDMFLDPAAHAAFTGAPVIIGAEPGARFEAFSGAIGGTVLHAEPKRLIVMRWRSVNFPVESVDSVAVLTFLPAPDGARVELVHVNVPEEDFAGVSQGWEKYYWAPWRTYLEKLASADAAS